MGATTSSRGVVGDNRSLTVAARTEYRSRDGKGAGRAEYRSRDCQGAVRLLAFVVMLALGGSAGYAQGLLDCGQAVDVALTADSPGNVRFQGTAGESVYIRLMMTRRDAGFSLKTAVLVDPYGNTSDPRPQDQTVAGATPADLASRGLEFDLPNVDGLYTLRLTGAGGEATVHAVLARLNRPCLANTALSCGRSLAGTISTSVPGQMDTYQYNVTAGDVVSFRLLRVATSGPLNTSTAFYFAVYAADASQNNRPRAVNVNAKTNGLSFTSISAIYGRYDWTATISGTVTVVAFETSGSLGGSYYISATKLNNGGCGGAALSCNSTVDGTLTSPLSYAFYSIQATAGDTYQFRTARTETSGTFAPAGEIYDAKGTSVATISANSATGHAASATAFRFPSSGRFSVLISGPLDGSLGSYSLATLRLNRPCDDAAALTCSSVVDGSIKGLIRSQMYSLGGSTGDAYLMRLLRPDATSAFLPRVAVYDTGGAPITTMNTADLKQIAFTIPADGAYTLVVDDSYDSAQSGSYALSVLRLNRPCGAGTLSCGAISPGSLPRSLSSSVYTYTAAAGESFSVRMLPGSGSPQPALAVYDSQGESVGQALSTGFSGVDVTKPAAGVYTVVATDSSTTPAASSFTLDLLRTTNACSLPAAQGVTVNGAVSASVPFLAYTMAVTSGDMLALRSSSSTPGFASLMELYDPTGVRLDPGVFSLTRKATVTGNYTVILGAAAPLTAGGFSFAWQLLNRPAGTAPLTCGGSTAGTLSASNQFRYYTLPASAGDVLRLLFNRISDNFSPQMELFDPTGTRVTVSSDVTHKAAASGNYLVAVSPSTSTGATGAYSVAFERPNNPCSPVALTCGQTALRQVNLPGQLDTFSFNGTGGDQTTVTLTARSGAYSPFVEMYNAAGTLVTTNSNGVLRRVLPADGGYTLLVRDRGGLNVGSYRVNLQDDTNVCPVNDTEAPTITLVRPTGGEVLPGGTTYHIQWMSDDNVGVSAHAIALSTDGGKTFADPLATPGGNLQAYDWIVPADVAPTRTAVLRITATDAAGNAQSAASGLLSLIGSGFKPNSSATYAYDELNRLVQATWSDGTSIQYTWDAAGNLTTITISGQ